MFRSPEARARAPAAASAWPRREGPRAADGASRSAAASYLSPVQQFKGIKSLHLLWQLAPSLCFTD